MSDTHHQDRVACGVSQSRSLVSGCRWAMGEPIRILGTWSHQVKVHGGSS